MKRAQQAETSDAADTTDAAAREAALAALFEAVGTAPRAHDFFALLRRVENLHPRWPRFGSAPRPSQEALRLGQDAELDFAPAAIESFEPRPGAPRLGVRFLGLLGPQGPMPLHLTEYARERSRLRGDPTLLRFLDIFHHRLLALFYRAWAQAQPAVQGDRPAEDRFAAWLGAGFGFDPELRASLPAQAQLFQAGLLGVRSRNAEGLCKLLAQYFRVPVRLEPHIAQWLLLDPQDRSRLGFALGRPERSALPAARLGHNASGGRKLLDRQYKFRIALGPLTLAQYLGFLPDGHAWPLLGDWVRLYVGLQLRWDVQLILAHAELPEPRLGRRVRLGLSAWLGGRGRERDRGDLRLRPDTCALLRQGAHNA
ncbi:type VI secretion system baseplate subunit TssG [Roseateles violae]|uniref:Type VI secretion system baseplate subunit TssG n=1 Tax=Roseateles violae TaxID=3058042 RepID=A0ABT8DV34_9BURK|nr:type VI secretion system baseplate subunit TssG [Pelomonas sp. PFR6]MDN3920026.1 type VI secretion system baseplate subunit TssG [Pelomonas sp. PFR6]